MLTDLTGIGAYPFRQYADDPNITVWFDMFNAAAQTYLDWFSGTTGEGAYLACYQGLSGQVLQWVAAGLYGQSYYNALSSPVSGAIGPLNTTPLNTNPLNAFTPPSETSYTITDDVFKRILTWNFFKGDGRRFCIRWLKRRVMRFLVGTNGIDPEPWNSGFVVGAENTSAISVEFSGQTCTVAINQIALSQMVQLAPNIIQIFEAAFLAPGVLEKPIEWNYAVSIVTSLSAIVSPASLSVVGATSSESTGSATVSAVGGSGSYTYAWSWQSGGSGITIVSPSAAVTNFSASSLTSGETLSGIAKCLVTDTVSHNTTTVAIGVSIERVSLPTATPSPTSISASGSTDTVTSGEVVVSAAGGGSPYSYLWTWQSGGTDISIDSSRTAQTTFTGTSLAPNETESGTALCTVTDSYGQNATCTVPVSISRATSLAVGISPSSLSVTGASSSESTGSTTVSVSGGVPPYSYSWAWQSGGSGISINSPSSATTSFTGTGLTPGTNESGTAICAVTDSVGQHGTTTCTVSITRVTTVSASVSPSSQTSSADAATQTTGTSTVTASGGSGTYGYSWTWISGGSGISINDPSSAATNFTASGMTLGDTYSGVAQCTVTDTYGQTAQASVSVSISYTPIGSAIIRFGYSSASGPPPSPTFQFYGYLSGTTGSVVSQSISIGTLSAANTTGETPYGGSTTTYTTTLAINASSNPGASYFTTMNTPFGNLTSASASYSYSGGVATWTWNGSTLWTSGTSGDEYTINLT